MADKAVCMESIRELYFNKHVRSVTGEVTELFACVEGIPAAQYYCCVLFYDVPTAKGCPLSTALLLASYATTKLLVEHHLGIPLTQGHFETARDLLLRTAAPAVACDAQMRFAPSQDTKAQKAERSPRKKTPARSPTASIGAILQAFCGNRSTTTEPVTKRLKTGNLPDLSAEEAQPAAACAALLSWLLKMEPSCHALAAADLEFVRELFTLSSAACKTEFLSLGAVSPLRLSLAAGFPDAGPFYRFAALRDSTDFDAALETATHLPYGRLKRAILRSEYPSIREMLGFFYKLYPEQKTYDGAVSPDRMVYLRSPDTIPLKPRLLRTYVGVIKTLQLEGSADISPFGTSAQNDADENDTDLYFGSMLGCDGPSASDPFALEMLYISRILASGSGKLLRQVVDCWFRDSEELVAAFLRARPEVPSFNKFVKHVPSIAGYFKRIFRLGKETREAYYFGLLEAILAVYPRRKDAQLVQENLLYFEQGFIKSVKHLLDHLEVE
ncbi:hypothetical protein PAPHI01_0873 [Pancytospora philotis]|nr:hypothetical protein PAPHI01_0873 [Pancytospora philotis]